MKTELTGKFFIELGRDGDVSRNGEILRVAGDEAVVRMPDALVSVALPFVGVSSGPFVRFKTVSVKMKDDWEIFDTHEAMCARINALSRARTAAREAACAMWDRIEAAGSAGLALPRDPAVVWLEREGAIVEENGVWRVVEDDE